MGCPRRRPWTKLRTPVCSYPIIVTHLSFNFLCLLLLYSIYLNDPTSHVYAKMALNLIEKVAVPASKSDSRKRKRSEESGSGSGTRGGAPVQPPRNSRHGDFQRDLSRDRPSEAGYNAHQSGSGYGSGNGDYRLSSYSRSNYNPRRGRAGSVSSRGTSGASGNRFDSDRGRSFQGSRGGFEGGYGGRGLPRGRPWPRW